MSHPAFRSVRTIRAMVLAALLAAPSLANVYVIDDDGGPGVDFTDLPPALAAALPGDVLLVQPGSYSAFTLSKGIAVLAQNGNATVSSLSNVAGLPAGQTARLLGLEFGGLNLVQCAGVVVLDDVTVIGSSTAIQALSVQACVDVRGLGISSMLQGANPAIGVGDTGYGLLAIGARVELVASQVHGRPGKNGGTTGDGGEGADGAVVDGGSRVHLVVSEAVGGGGGDGSPLCFPTGTFGGNGGNGALLKGGSDLLAMGTPSVSKLHAGYGGGFCFGGPRASRCRPCPAALPGSRDSRSWARPPSMAHRRSKRPRCSTPTWSAPACPWPARRCASTSSARPATRSRCSSAATPSCSRSPAC